MFALSFFAKPWTKTALVPRLYRIIARKPPDFPLPGLAIRCLMTPPPRSASIKPRSAFAIASHRVGSSRPAFRANLVKGFVLEYPHLFREAPQHRHFSCIALSVIDVKLSSFLQELLLVTKAA